MSAEGGSMTKWFGQPWPSEQLRAPVCEDDADRCATPVGMSCIFCDHPIVQGDQGTMIPECDESGTTLRPTHCECMLRTVLGCYSNLMGRGHDHDVDLHQDALRVRAWVDSQA